MLGLKLNHISKRGYWCLTTHKSLSTAINDSALYASPIQNTLIKRRQGFRIWLRWACWSRHSQTEKPVVMQFNDAYMRQQAMSIWLVELMNKLEPEQNNAKAVISASVMWYFKWSRVIISRILTGEDGFLTTCIRMDYTWWNYIPFNKAFFNIVYQNRLHMITWYPIQQNIISQSR